MTNSYSNSILKLFYISVFCGLTTFLSLYVKYNNKTIKLNYKVRVYKNILSIFISEYIIPGRYNVYFSSFANTIIMNIKSRYSVIHNNTEFIKAILSIYTYNE